MFTSDLRTTIGSLFFKNPVMTAAGTSGYSDELADYFDLGELGAVVVKSLSFKPWDGNPSPRLHPTPSGMLNSVGLQGPGVDIWLEKYLPPLVSSGVRVVASIWGNTVEDFALAAKALSSAPPEVVAIEINASCPNLEDHRRLFAHSVDATSEVVEAASLGRRPCWVKLSPNTWELPEIALAAVEAGAEAVTVSNTVMGMAIDVNSRRPFLGAGRGGLSGSAIRPIAVRAVYDVYKADPTLPIIGVGGIATPEDVIEFLLAGASAVQVGTANFADPRAAIKILTGLKRWCDREGVASLVELIGAAHE